MADLALARNRFVTALADEIFVAHAAEDGKIEAFCCELAAWGKSLSTLDSEYNANLMALGAHAIGIAGQRSEKDKDLKINAIEK